MNSEITVFNKEGIEIGTKSKKEIDKRTDIFQTVYVRVFIGEKILLIKVLQKEGGIAKTNEGKWGLPVATIIRRGESPEEAFKRACIDDIGMVPMITKSYDNRMVNFKSTSPRIVFAYDAIIDSIPDNINKEFLLVDPNELKLMYDKGDLAETAMIFD